MAAATAVKYLLKPGEYLVVTTTLTGAPYLTVQISKQSTKRILNSSYHSAELREAAASEPEHTPYLAAAAFKSTQIIWKGPVKISSSSPVSSDTHYICSCEKKQYLGVDASRSQGIFMLNLQRVPGFPALPDAYRPNHHVFYCERKIDVLDGLPKWKTIVGGDVIGEVSTGSSRLVRQQGSAHRPEDSKGDRPLEWTPRGVRKDVLPLSPIRPPESDVYHFTENDPPMNSSTKISPEKIHERVQKKYFSSPGVYVAPTKTKREVVVIGGGHNGLIAAAYLAKAGIDTLVLERCSIHYSHNMLLLYNTYLVYAVQATYSRRCCSDRRNYSWIQIFSRFIPRRSYAPPDYQRS